MAVIGDGVNDAPAFRGYVGVAMGSDTDIAREVGDVLLLRNDLAKFTEILQIARWPRRIIWQNFYGTIAVEIAGMALPRRAFSIPRCGSYSCGFRGDLYPQCGEVTSAIRAPIAHQCNSMKVARRPLARQH